MLTQIEQALIRCNGDKFALHCRRYLAYKYPTVMSPGFVLGKEKSKIGTPDIFIPFEGYYIFCEITTQSNDLEKKFKKDILHCLKQVDIPLNKIVKIILMCNSKVSPAVLEQAIQYKDSFYEVIELEIIDVENFSNRLLNGYHAIIEDLGIPVTTAQIVEPLDFIEKYSHSGFAISLTNQFFNRDNELTEALKILRESDMLMIAGDPGVGKTKLALELCTKFKETNPNFSIKVIRSNGDLPIWNDLQTQLHPDCNYILLVDDANKLRFNLEYVINFRNQLPVGQNIKAIFTVRTYVKSEVDSCFKRLGVTDYGFMDLKKFDLAELSTILKSSDFNIAGRDAARIYEISKGNPRLAIMCAIAGKEDRKYLKNASAIYEKYFSNILTSLGNIFNDIEVLKVLGVLSLFRSINFNNENQIDSIEKIFGIEKKKLRETCIQLDTFEITEERFDIYKISDQILGEYFFYKVFIEKQYLPFVTLLDMAYDRSEITLGYIMDPIIAHYGFEDVKSKIVIEIKQKWKTLDCDVVSIRFLKDFWRFLPADTLKYFQDRINKLETANYERFKFVEYEPNHIASFKDEIIEILVKFRELPTMFNYAHELLIAYCLKSELLFSKLLKAYKQAFIFGHNNYENLLISQAQIIDFLYTQLPKNEIFFSKILLYIAPEFLRDHHEGLRHLNLGDSTLEIQLILPQELKRYRKSYLSFVFKSFSNTALKDSVYDCLQTYFLYLQNSYCVLEICKLDKKLIDDFILCNFKSDNYNDCFIANIYVNSLRTLGIPIIKSIRNDFKDRKFMLYLTLNQDLIKRKEFHGNYNEFETYKCAELKKFTKEYSIKEYIQLFEDIEYILVENKRFIRDYPITNSINIIMHILSQADRDLFLLAVKKMLPYSFSNNQTLHNLFGKFDFNNNFSKRTRKLLVRDKNGVNFLMNFWFRLPQEYFIKEDLEIFQELITSNKFKSIWSLEIVLEKSLHLFDDYVTEIHKMLDIIVNRTISGDNIYLDIGLFKYLSKSHPEIFAARKDDLQRLYIYADKNAEFDYDLSMLKYFLTYDLTLLNPYLESNFEKNTFYTRTNLSNSYLSELWTLDYECDEVFTIIFDYFKDHLSFLSYTSELTYIFKGQSKKEIRFLQFYIECNEDDKSLLLAYNVVLSLYKDHWNIFIDLLLQKNDTIDFFRKINFYLSPSITYSGSYIPRIHAEIMEIQKVKAYLENKGNFKYIDHIQYLEEKLDSKNVQIEHTRKREFLSDWGYY